MVIVTGILRSRHAFEDVRVLHRWPAPGRGGTAERALDRRREGSE